MARSPELTSLSGPVRRSRCANQLSRLASRVSRLALAPHFSLPAARATSLLPPSLLAVAGLHSTLVVAGLPRRLGPQAPKARCLHRSSVPRLRSDPRLRPATSRPCACDSSSGSPQTAKPQPAGQPPLPKGQICVTASLRQPSPAARLLLIGIYLIWKELERFYGPATATGCLQGDIRFLSFAMTGYQIVQLRMLFVCQLQEFTSRQHPF